MTTQFATFIRRSGMSALRITLMGAVFSSPLLFAQDHSAHSAAQPSGTSTGPSKLVQDVRQATTQFINVNNAAPDYVPAFGCVSGSDHGAMGIHYVNGALIDGVPDRDHPEALIYEPVGSARRLVGVEYIVDAKAWVDANGKQPPSLDGQVFNFVDAPNRFQLDPFFELHVWAWRDNPQGAFVDWNNDVTCDGMQ